MSDKAQENTPRGGTAPDGLAPDDTARGGTAPGGTALGSTAPGGTAARGDAETGDDAADHAGAAPANPEDLDDMKRKFREALDRKKQANSKGAADSAGSGSGKTQVAHGPASSRRSFRRKSG